MLGLLAALPALAGLLLPGPEREARAAGSPILSVPAGQQTERLALRLKHFVAATLVALLWRR